MVSGLLAVVLLVLTDMLIGGMTALRRMDATSLSQILIASNLDTCQMCKDTRSLPDASGRPVIGR
ncbi:hypothetical protein [Candidatus Doolittlea endobia]|uniref:Uncharacterized protein n=1 Tax=Candidatus Doolittlea endobia TaxID=1778262 RepID=A0A143WRL0_9ENTR|nr:hypothetical protein [Candidatus Doolittlea endobia]CUX96446.1 hypothetical protein MHIR_DE00102 [Candidatus Doolittlea endobia]